MKSDPDAGLRFLLQWRLVSMGSSTALSTLGSPIRTPPCCRYNDIVNYGGLFIELCSFCDVILAGYDAQPGLPRQEDLIKLEDDKIVIQRSESFIHLSSCREYYTCSTTCRTPPFLPMGISILLMPIRL